MCISASVGGGQYCAHKCSNSLSYKVEVEGNRERKEGKKRIALYCYCKGYIDSDLRRKLTGDHAEGLSERG